MSPVFTFLRGIHNPLSVLLFPTSSHPLLYDFPLQWLGCFSFDFAASYLAISLSLWSSVTTILSPDLEPPVLVSFFVLLYFGKGRQDRYQLNWREWLRFIVCRYLGEDKCMERIGKIRSKQNLVRVRLIYRKEHCSLRTEKQHRDPIEAHLGSPYKGLWTRHLYK